MPRPGDQAPGDQRPRDKVAADTLDKYAQRLQHALDGAGQGVWDHDMVNGTVYYSQTWRLMRGYGPEDDVDALAGPWLTRLHPDDRERIEAEIALQDSGKLASNAFEYRERHRDGHWIWILSRGRPSEWSADGSVARIVGTDTDITALKAVAFALAEEKERLHVTLSAIAEGLVSIDVDGRIVNFNSAAATLTGVAIDSAVGQQLDQVLDLRSSTGAPMTAQLLIRMRSLETPLTISDDIQLVGSDGSRRHIHCSISPVATDRGRLGAVIVLRDVTHDQSLKEELKRAASHDVLTGLPNRLAFNQALEAAVEDAAVHGGIHHLCLLDLDGFKRVNDGAGHAAGDQVLIAVAETLRTAAGQRDFVGRLGGDEFVLIVKHRASEDAFKACDDLVRTIETMVFAFEGMRFRIGGSIGIRLIDPALTPSTLLMHADKACYRAKSMGKGQVAMHDCADQALAAPLPR